MGIPSAQGRLFDCAGNSAVANSQDDKILSGLKSFDQNRQSGLRFLAGVRGLLGQGADVVD
jgi:hypothetical protein